MLEQNKQELDRLMNLYNETLHQIESKKDQERAELDSFKKRFEDLKHHVIWPVIADIGNELTNYGHDFHVSEEDESLDAIAVYHPASITFNIYPSFLEQDYRKPDSAPYISFLANPYAKKITLVLSTMMAHHGGSVGNYDEIDIDSLNTEWVENKIVEVLKSVLLI